jgi:hypothetical protein
MAGDWLKVEANTPDKPEVFEIATQLKVSPTDVFGRLFLVWRFFDQHTQDGNAVNVTSAYLDHIAGVTGFADAMRCVGWLHGGESGNMGLRLPNFGRHNGKTAKARALTGRRVGAHKQRKGNAEGNGEVTLPALPREEKRRSKEQPPVSPLTFPAGVEENRWNAFRESRRKLRKPMTAYAEQRALDTLVRLVGEGYDAPKLIDKAIELGWQTFYPRDECRATVAPSERAKSEACPCGKPGSVKVGGKWRCAAHVGGVPVPA